VSPLQIIFALIGAAPQIMHLFSAVVAEVHTIQTQLPGAPGADKSQAVLDKVTPIAQAVDVELPHVQSLINQVVDMSKQYNLGAWAGTDPIKAGS
jgi:hypothetical protein